ncbi:hypothetical protein BU17DRAFT_70376 [Hysterangium stoloniferum]|nr:hypothetical protein BU17DRAFT_70376 [Hysterangium stoloniferum]
MSPCRGYRWCIKAKTVGQTQKAYEPGPREGYQKRSGDETLRKGNACLKKLRLETRRFWSAGHACKAKKQGARHLWIGVSQAVVYIPPFSDFVVFITLHQWMHAPISSLITAYRGPALTVAMKGHGATKRGPAAHAGIREGPRYAQMAPGQKRRCASCRELNIKCERARPWTKCIDNPRKGKGQKSKVKVACASCRAGKVQCDVDRPCKRCVKRKIQCVNPCWACGCEVPGCMSCVESSGGTHHHHQSSPAEASTSSSLQDKATPTSPSSPLESPLSPYSHQSLHNHTARFTGSQFSYSHSVSIPGVPDTSLSISAALYIPSRSQHNDYEESPGSPMSPLSPDPLQVPSASLYRTTAHPVEPRLYSDGDAQRPVSPASCYPSQRRHSGSYETPTVSDESAPALSPLGMDSHPQASGSQPLQRSLPFTSPLTRPLVIHEPPKVTLPSFAEAFPEFVGSSLSNLRAGGRIISYPG